MKRTKTQKGITLIALIITIVVLLILASVAISSIQNDGILSYAENVANKYNQSQRDEQSVIDKYLGYLKGEEWTTIYDGAGVTDDEGMVTVANKHIFKNRRTYKITVESDEFNGTVETVAVFYGSEAGEEAYMLFGITEGRAVTASSLVEYMELMELLEDGTLAIGINGLDGIDGNMSAIVFEGCTCEYKVLKIEEKTETKTEDSSLIFEGSATVTNNFGTDGILEGLTKEMSLKKIYRVEAIIDGTKFTANTITGALMFSPLPCVIASFGNSNILYIIPGDGPIALATTWSGNCVITAIYEEEGEVDNCVEENGFVALYSSDLNEWGLYSTPDTSYIVPKTVEGKEITRTWVDALSGTPTFTSYIGVGVYDMTQFNKEYKVIMNDSDEINRLIVQFVGCLKSSVIDLTECGDNLTFTDEILNYLSINNNILHVTSAVKAKYSDNANIVVPQS